MPGRKNSKVNEITVRSAIQTLKERGDRVTYLKIISVIGGGSPNSVQKILDQIGFDEEVGLKMPTEFPQHGNEMLMGVVYEMIREATESLQNSFTHCRINNAELMDEVDRLQDTIEFLESQLSDASGQHQADCQKIVDIETRYEQLSMKCQQLTEASEVARIEASKAMLQLERADDVAAKAERQVAHLESKLERETEKRHNAEVRAAAAEAKRASNG